MKLFGYELLIVKQGRYIVVDVKKRIRDIYIKGGNEAAYAAYRVITGATVQESWKVVKPWVREWERGY